MADQGHYGGRVGETRQGIYVCSPNGKLLASINSNRAERVLAMMQRGLEGWEKLPEEQRHIPDDAEIKPQHRWEDSYPADGLVLSVVMRDLPADCSPASPCTQRWNRDHAWFSKAEAVQWLPEDPNVGDRHTVPAALVERLTRMHLVDSVGGQTNRFTRREVEGSQIATEVLEVNDAQVRLRITGTTRAVSEGRGRAESPNGVASRLLGYATFDRKKHAFTEFDLVAVGTRWGNTRYNGRRRQRDASPIGYAFRLARPEAPAIAPAFIGWYDVEWVEVPDRRRY